MGRHRRTDRNRRNDYLVQILEPRVLLSAISGKLWNDANSNGLLDSGESGLSGWTVYLDQNRNHVRDTGETFTTTAAGGSYSFSGLAAGTYYVGEEIPLGWSQTYPDVNGI